MIAFYPGWVFVSKVTGKSILPGRWCSTCFTSFLYADNFYFDYCFTEKRFFVRENGRNLIEYTFYVKPKWLNNLLTIQLSNNKSRMTTCDQTKTKFWSTKPRASQTKPDYWIALFRLSVLSIVKSNIGIYCRRFAKTLHFSVYIPYDFGFRGFVWWWLFIVLDSSGC